MKRPSLRLLLAGVALSGMAAPAMAQMDHSKMPGMNMPAPKKPAAKKAPAKRPVAKKATAKKPAAKKPGAAKPAPKKAAAKRPAGAKAADPHAGHDMSQMPGQQQPAPAMPPGHDMSQMPPQQPAPAMPPGHDMSQMPGTAAPPGQQMPGREAAAGTNLPAGNAAPPPVPADHAADTVYGTPAMAEGRHHLQKFHGGQKLLRVLFNVADYQIRNGRDAIEWDAKAWYGGDIDRLWVKTEGESEISRAVERAEVQLLYGRAINPYFDIQAGIRYDFKPNPSRVYATLGVEGLAPSFFDVEGILFLSNKGELLARAEGYYDQRITQRLILQPRAELNFAAQNSRQIGVGRGLSDAEIGLRLRYDFRREFAPYVGAQYRRAFGRTRNYLSAEGEDPDGWSLLTGVRFWF